MEVLKRRRELFDPCTSLAGIVANMLSDKTVVMQQSKEAVAMLLNYCIVAIREEKAKAKAKAKPVSVYRDWRVDVGHLGCTCSTCTQAITFLQSKTADQTLLRGRHATYRGHTSALMIEAARKSRGDFTATVLTSRATTVNGKLNIVKNSRGRPPPNQLLDWKSMDKNLVSLVKLRNELGIVVALDSDEPDPKRIRLDG